MLLPSLLEARMPRSESLWSWLDTACGFIPTAADSSPTHNSFDRTSACRSLKRVSFANTLNTAASPPAWIGDSKGRSFNAFSCSAIFGGFQAVSAIHSSIYTPFHVIVQVRSGRSHLEQKVIQARGSFCLPSLPLGRGSFRAKREAGRGALESIKSPLSVPKRDDPFPNGREGGNPNPAHLMEESGQLARQRRPTQHRQHRGDICHSN